MGRGKAKYVWMVMDSKNECDIRRYAFDHTQAIAQLDHPNGRRDRGKSWALFKLVRVNCKKAK